MGCYFLNLAAVTVTIEFDGNAGDAKGHERVKDHVLLSSLAFLNA